MGLTFDAGGLIAIDRNDRRILLSWSAPRSVASALRFQQQRSRKSCATLPAKLVYPV